MIATACSRLDNVIIWRWYDLSWPQQVYDYRISLSIVFQDLNFDIVLVYIVFIMHKNLESDSLKFETSES